MGDLFIGTRPSSHINNLIRRTCAVSYSKGPHSPFHEYFPDIVTWGNVQRSAARALHWKPILTECPNEIELLAPAGNHECLRAAVANGADSVYFGLNSGFNARARAENSHSKNYPV